MPHAGFFPGAAKTAAPATGSAGFSILEVLTALVIAATLATAILGVQRHCYTLSQGSAANWENLNMSMEILAKRYPGDMKRPTAGWLPWPDNADAKFKLVQDTTTSRNFNIFQLMVKVPGSEMTWEWLNADQ